MQVKKWQASLPSIHLLGYDHSTSNSDIGDSKLKSPRLVKKCENQGLITNVSNRMNTTTTGVGRFTKSEQDLSSLKTFSLSSSHQKNSSSNSMENKNNRAFENKFVVSNCLQKYPDLSLPLYLTTYRSSNSTYIDKVETINGSNECNDFRTKYYNSLSVKSSYPNSENSSNHFSHYHSCSPSQQIFGSSHKNFDYKQSHNTKCAESLETRYVNTPSIYNSDQINESINFNDPKHEIISHCYWTNNYNEMSDCQKRPVTTDFHGHTNYIKQTPLNSRSLGHSTSECSVPDISKNNNNRSNYKMHGRIELTDTVPDILMPQREDIEDNASMSSILSSLNEYKCNNMSNYKSLNSPKRKKYNGDKYVPNKIKKITQITDQTQSVLGCVINSESESRTEKSEYLEVNGNKNTERPLVFSTTLPISEMRKCKRTNKNDFTSVLDNGYKKEQGKKNHLVADKLLEERNFLYAKQTPLPVDDIENELINDTYGVII